VTIVVHLSSGLGNQLFQYAAGRALQLSHGGRLVGEAVAFSPRFKQPQRDRHTPRELAIDLLGLPLTFRCPPTTVLASVRGYSRFRSLVRDGTKAHVRHDDHGFREIPRSRRGVVLRGYFQDRKYWGAHAKTIVADVSRGLSALSEEQQSKRLTPPESRAAVHVRRGDYLKNENVFPQRLQDDYYPQVLEHLLCDRCCDGVDVYSDDMEFAESSARRYGERVRAVSPDPRSQGVFDLLALSRYRTLAIANSTFSFWAAAVASSHRARIIAPSLWATWCPNPQSRLYESTWDVLELC
jgi:hypothetical protein